MEEHLNPLLNYIRKPKPILNLSSHGNFWPEGLLEKSTNIDVYPLTGQDELLLLNTNGTLFGSVLAEIIGNCIPSIKDVWSMPRIDIDSVLIAIRCASYNNSMNLDYSCPECNEHQSHSVANLLAISDQIHTPDYSVPLTIDNIAIWFRPPTFKETFQQSTDQSSKLAVLKQLANESLTEEEKEKIAKNNLIEITKINIRTITNSIDRIMVDNTITVTNPDHINEWILQVERDVFVKIKEAVNAKNAEYQLPKEKVVCHKCNHEHEIDIEFNPADFLNSGD